MKSSKIRNSKRELIHTDTGIHMNTHITMVRTIVRVRADLKVSLKK